MLTGQELKQDINSNRNALLKSMVTCNERIDIGRRSAERSGVIEKDLSYYEKAASDLRGVINHITREYKNIEQYLIDKKENSVETLELAVRKAGAIVPDAKIDGMHLVIADKSAKIADKRGQDINLREGSALRAIMGLLMRYTLVKFQPDCIQAIFLDEALSTLSSETSVLLREYLDIFKEDILIVGIEQRNVLFEGIDKTVYNVSKDNETGYTIVKKEK